MKIITGSTGTPHVTSNNAGELHQAIFGTGSMVFDLGNALEANLIDNNNISISDGDLMIQGRHALIDPGTTENVTIDTGALGLNRNDLIVARYALDDTTGHESITLEVIKGEESSGDPVTPSYTSGDIRTGSTLVDFPLYRVEIRGLSVDEIVALFTPTPPIGGGSMKISANNVTAGTLDGKVRANATAQAVLSDAQLRDISAGDTDLTAGTDHLDTGTLYAYYE